jgi:hypothetical protein
MSGRIIAIGTVITVIAGTACGSAAPQAGDTSGPAPSVAVRPSSTADLSIATPRNGQVIRASALDVKVNLRGARLVTAATTDLQPDEGHLHVTLDDQLITMTSALEQKIPDVGPGPHLLKVEFVASDHSPFDPRVIAAVTFRVAPS